MRAALLLCALLGAARPLYGQSWRTALTVSANASLWIDYCQVRYGQRHDSPTWFLVRAPLTKFTPLSITIVNAGEIALNTFAPRKFRPWVNALTLAFHLVAIAQTARRPLADGVHLGIRFTP